MTRAPHPVLVVEDDADIRDAMVGILESAGYAVCAASHGADALAQLQAGNRPCIILLDLMMPVMDGWTFGEEKEKDPSLAEIPVVVVSAVSQHDPRNARMRAVDHLSKPLNIDKLLATVERFC
jgi:CheY-like chemotaxis protein